MGAGEDREAHGVGVLLHHGRRDLLRRLVEAGVDDLHARVAQAPGDDLRAAVVAVEAGLRDDDADGAVAGGLRVSHGTVGVLTHARVSFPGPPTPRRSPDAHHREKVRRPAAAKARPPGRVRRRPADLAGPRRGGRRRPRRGAGRARSRTARSRGRPARRPVFHAGERPRRAAGGGRGDRRRRRRGLARRRGGRREGRAGPGQSVAIVPLPPEAGAAEVSAFAEGLGHGRRTASTASRSPRREAEGASDRLAVHSAPLRSADLARAERIVEAVNAARDLVNTPSNHLTPTDAGRLRARRWPTPRRA